MTLWWTLVTLCCALGCVASAAPGPLVQTHKYKKSFRLTTFTRTRVQHLLKKYKEQQMGNVHFEDRSRRLRDLPLLSTDFYRWLSLSDWDRLHAAVGDMQAYWGMLERKRKQLEEEQREQMAVQATQSRLVHSIRHIQLYLQDLISQVSSQVSTALTVIRPRCVPTPAHADLTGKTVWDSRVEGYIILRDLDLYLTKLARDFLLLASKAHA
uniref:Uncharacterized LOC112451383 n=1 Tax=Kryptolebias marmoratus TaxID=37003 RepID=A0A3Q3AZT1_KRYMA